MKILITGQPRSGKSTLLKALIASEQDAQGFVTVETLDAEGERTGFELESSDKLTATLASVESTSEVRVSRYGVDLGSLEGFVESTPTPRVGALLYMDEVGQMQLMSDAFISLAKEYLVSDEDLVGTVTCVFDHPFIGAIRDMDDVQTHPELYELATELLKELEGQVDVVLLQLGFKLRLLDALGYRPQLDGCAVCGDNDVRESYFLSPEAGGLVHRHCAVVAGEALDIPAIKLWRIALDSPLRELGKIRSAAELARQTMDRCDLFYEYHFGRTFRSGMLGASQ